MTVPRYCPDCDSKHIGLVPCGMSWLQRLRSTGVSADALPTRTPKRYRDIKETEAGWQKDFPAYRRLVKAGKDPGHADGAAEVERSLGG